MNMSEQDRNDMKPDISENNNSEDVTNQNSTDLESRETPKKRRSFIEVAEEEKKLPEIRRLQGLFESLEDELNEIQVTNVDGEGLDSDKESDDGLKKEVRELPNSSIHDMHTIVTSAKGSRLLVTPSNKTGDLEGRQFLREEQDNTTTLSSTPTTTAAEVVVAVENSSTTPKLQQSQTNSSTSHITETPLRVRFSHSQDPDLSDTDTPTRMPTSPTGEMPSSTGTKHGHHGFTPMTLQQLMRLETPESRVEEMLQELYSLMGDYGDKGEPGNWESTTSLRDLDPELGMALFDSPLPAPRMASSGSSSTIAAVDDAVIDAYLGLSGAAGGGSISTTSSGSLPTLGNVASLTLLQDTNALPPPEGRVAAALQQASAVQTAESATSELDAQTSPHTAPVPASTAEAARGRLRSNSHDIDRDIQDIVQMGQAGRHYHSTSTAGSTTTNPAHLSQSTYNAGWVDVNKEAKLHQSIVHGDFYIWNEGPKLTTEYINCAYVGMHTSAVTHNNDNGVLVPAAVQKPANIPGTNIPAGVYANAAARASGSQGAIMVDSISISSGSSTATAGGQTSPIHKHGYYVVFLLECVVRPDVELRQLLASVLKVARTRECKCYFPHNNHVIVKSQSSQHSHTLHSGSNGGGSGGGSSIVELREWDQIDIQVVVSKEVKQRMLVCQFLRRVPSLSTSGFGNLNLIIYQIAGGAAPLTLQNSPKTKSFVSKLKRELTEHTLCLSSVYNAPLHTICALPQQSDGLDAHFRLQLQQQVYGHMWARLETDVKLMSEHLQSQLRACHDFLHTLEPMYKVYGLAQPVAWSASAQRHHQHHLLPSPTPSGALSPTSPTAADLHCTPVRTPATYTEVGPTATTERLPTRQSDAGTPPPSATVVSNKHTTTTAASAQTTAKCSAATTTATTPAHTATTPSSASKHSGEDAMTVVLLTMHQCQQDIQDSCDAEYARRVQLQNEWVIRQVENMEDYKHSLLFTLASNPDACEAPIMKTFTATFQDVPVTIDAAGNVTPSGSGAGSAPNSRSNSADRGSGDARHFETSLYSEFKDSPVPKAGAASLTTVGLHNNNSRSGSSSTGSKTTATTVTASEGAGWMRGLTQAFSSFTASTPTTTKAVQQAVNNKEQTPHITVSTAAVTSTDAATHTTVSSHALHPGTEIVCKSKEHQREKETGLYTPTKGEVKEVLHAHEEAEEGGFTLLRSPESAASLIALTPAVLYYCSCLVSKSPGTIYITPTSICLTSTTALLTMRQNKEVFPLSALSDVLLPAQWLPRTADSSTSGGSVSMLYSNTLQLVFFRGGHSASTSSTGSSTATGGTPSNTTSQQQQGREVLVSPMLVDCAKLRHVLLEVKAAFAHVR